MIHRTLVKKYLPLYWMCNPFLVSMVPHVGNCKHLFDTSNISRFPRYPNNSDMYIEGMRNVNQFSIPSRNHHLKCEKRYFEILKMILFCPFWFVFFHLRTHNWFLDFQRRNLKEVILNFTTFCSFGFVFFFTTEHIISYLVGSFCALVCVFWLVAWKVPIRHFQMPI